MILWKIGFWLTFVILIVPLALKLAGYISGKDTSSLKVKIEEVSNALVLSVGLIAFWGHAYSTTTIFPAIFWYIWLAINFVGSIRVIFTSSYKLDYVQSIFGKRGAIILGCISTVLLAPMFVAVFYYALSIS